MQGVDRVHRTCRSLTPYPTNVCTVSMHALLHNQKNKLHTTAIGPQKLSLIVKNSREHDLLAYTMEKVIV